MDAKPTKIDLFHIFKSKQVNFITTKKNNILDLEWLKLCKISKSFMILILIIFRSDVK